MSVLLASIQSSLASLLVIFMAHSADSYFGRFHTLLFSNTAYIGGLMLLWLFNPYDVKWLLVIAIVLLSLGASGANILEDVLYDLVNYNKNNNSRLHHIDDDETRKRSVARADMWLRLTYMSGAISAILWVTPDAVGGVTQSWGSSFLICTIAMTAALIIFCKGHNKYRQRRLRERPAQVFFRVFDQRFKTWRLHHSSRSLKKFSRQANDHRSLRNSDTENIGIEESSSNKQKDTMIVKSLLRMFPMWIMFFAVSIISATGFTFFFQQYTNLNVSKTIPVQIYNVAQESLSFATPILYSSIRCLRNKQKLKIGVGMLCGILSCIFAWRLEVYRLKEVGHLVDKDLSTSISFLWLVPQFCVLGCMEGLTKDGLLKFYKSQMKEQPLLIDYGEEYIEIVMGIGKLINIFLVLIFNKLWGWFGETINDSRVDRYYLVLSCVCATNFVAYCCIARFYYGDVGEELDNDDNQEEVAAKFDNLLQDVIDQIQT